MRKESVFSKNNNYQSRLLQRLQQSDKARQAAEFVWAASKKKAVAIGLEG